MTKRTRRNHAPTTVIVGSIRSLRSPRSRASRRSPSAPVIESMHAVIFDR
jgi:hypothetical protein